MKKLSRLIHVVTIATMTAGLIQSQVFPGKAQAAAERISLSADKTLSAPVIDGKLDDPVWHIDKPLNVRTGDGTFKDSAFGLLWDNKYLYIGVKVDDDNLISGAAGNWFDQDNINIFLDPTKHQSAPFAADDMQLGFVYKAGTTVPEFHFGAAANGQSAKDESKILRAIQTTATGWSLEVAVPWDMMNFDPVLVKQLGVNIGVTDRYDAADAAKQRNSFWSAYNETSFWNNTAGYGLVTLGDNVAAGTTSQVLLEENFDGVAAGQLPAGWVTDVTGSSKPFTVVQDTYGDGRLLFDGNASGTQSRILAPVQSDGNYTIEADVRFDAFLNTGRWASIMFRAPLTGKPPYLQMAIKPVGVVEVAYRKPDGSWVSPISGNGPVLTTNKDYTMKVRVFENRVQDYFKVKTDPSFTLYGDKKLTPDVLPAGRFIGFQGDQSKVSFDNVKVTRITADRIDGFTLPATAEALTGPMSVTGSVYFSDGVTDALDPDKVKFYSSDPSVIRIQNNKIYPVGPGTASVKAVYYNAEASQQVTVSPSAAGVQVTALKHADGYLLATTGQAKDLAAVTFNADFNDLTSGPITGDKLNWTSASGDVTFAGGKMTVSRKGVYSVTAQKDSSAVTMLIVAKDESDSDYVLYEENFDAAADGTLPAGWTKVQGAGTAGVQGGTFVMDASAAPNNPSRVLLPDYLGLFGNYKIEADVTHVSANDAGRWNSIMYRVQNNNYPYYQMAVRKDATAANGVEFAENTPAGAWNVMVTGSYSEPISADKMYHYKVIASGNRVQEWIGDQLVVDADQATAYTKGRIGLQANGSKMKVDNLKVTLQQSALPLPSDQFVRVATPDTKLALAPSVAAEIRSSGELTAMLGASSLPGTVMLPVNSGLQVTDRAGSSVIGSLDTVLATIGTRVIPAFYVKDELTVDKLVQALKNASIEDAFIVSDNGDLVKRAQTAYPIIRGILDFTTGGAIDHDNLLDVRRKTASSQARIALLPQSVASSKETVAYLQERGILVWAKEAASPADKSLAMHRLITAGADGIVTDSPAAAFDAYKVYANNTTLVRKPFILAHRGLSMKAPENTMESNILGLDAGADFIENDMWLTTDGHIAIVHDDTVDRTTNGTGKVESFTLAQLKQLNANKPYPTGFPDVKILSWDEQIDLAQSRGRMVQSEIKSYKPEMVDAVIQVIKDKHAEETVNMMSFNNAQMLRMRQLMPEMPTILLVNSISSNETNPNKSLRDALRLTQSTNSTFNVGYYGIGKNFLETAHHHGLLAAPWTIDKKQDFIDMYMLGVWGITTNGADYTSDWAASIRPGQEAYALTAGDSQSVTADVYTYKGAGTSIRPDIVLLDGQQVIDVNGSSVTAKQAGTAHVLLRYTQTVDDGSKYDIYTQPVAVNVAERSTNANLSGILLSTGTLTPAFDSGRESYDVTVGINESSIGITPTVENDRATLTINGTPSVSGTVYEAALMPGLNMVTINVTAEDGSTTKEYRLNINRSSAPVLSTNANLSGILLSTGTLTPAFDSGRGSYDVTVGINESSIGITPTVENDRATLTINGTTLVSGAVYEAALMPGLNRVTVNVTAEDGSSTKEYRLNINRSSAPVLSHNANLSGILLSTGTMTPAFNASREEYDVTVGSQVSRIGITSTVEEEHATLTVNGTATVSGSVYEAFLQTGLNLVTIVITAEDGITTKTYLLNITRNSDTVEPTPVDPTPSPNPGGTGKPDPGTGTTSDIQVNGQPAKADMKPDQDGRIVVKTDLVTEDGKVEVKLTPSALQAVSSAKGGSALVIDTKLGSFSLPLDQLHLEAWAKQLGIEAKQLHLAITLAEDKKAAAEAVNAGTTVHASISFTLTAQTDGGKSETVSAFTRYVPRTIVLNEPFNPQTLAVVRVEKDRNGRTVYTPVPFTVGKNEVVAYSRGNSTYLVVDHRVSFADLSSHWSKQLVEQMAGRYIVQGMSEGIFAPDRPVTRAEFTAMIVRALGLSAAATQSNAFSDIHAADWYAEAIGTAVANGIVGGYEDQSFRPNAGITRQEMAVILNRAMQFAGYKKANAGGGSASFADQGKIADWAKDAVGTLVSMGIVEGMESNRYVPAGGGTRAESATMIGRMMAVTDFSK